MERRVAAILLLILFSFASSNSFPAEKRKPSIVVLIEPSSKFTLEELLSFHKTSNEIFGQTKAYQIISPSSVDKVFWGSLPAAVSYSNSLSADYVLYLGLSKGLEKYSYDARLMKAKTFSEVGKYHNSWVGTPDKTQDAMFSLVSGVAYDSLAKITVHMTIVCDPKNSDVYRDNDRLGDTGETGFRGTYWLDKGYYKIRVCKPGYGEKIEDLEVKTNPTIFERQVKLRKK